jgi:hypothetical protein
VSWLMIRYVALRPLIWTWLGPLPHANPFAPSPFIFILLWDI